MSQSVRSRPVRQSSFAAATLVAASLFTSCNAGPAAPAVTADTWAMIDTKAITKGDVDKAYDRNRDTETTLSADETLLTKLSVLDDLITQELILARAPALQLTVPDADLDKAYTEAKKGVADDAFRQQLQARNLTETDMRESLRRSLLAEKVLDKEITQKVAVSDQEVTDFFNANKAQFNVPEDALHLAQIVVTPTQDAQVSNTSGDDATTPQIALSKAQSLMQQLQNGASFVELARQYSEDPDTAPRGGDMGLVPVSAFQRAPAVLRTTVLGMEQGKARLVNDGSMFRIILLVSKEAAGQRDLSTPGTKEQITSALKTRKEQVLREAYLRKLHSDAKVTNYVAGRIVDNGGKL